MRIQTLTDPLSRLANAARQTTAYDDEGTSVHRYRRLIDRWVFGRKVSQLKCYHLFV